MIDDRSVPAVPPAIRLAIVFVQLLSLAGVWSVAEYLFALDRILTLLVMGLAAILISPVFNGLLSAVGVEFITRKGELKRFGVFGVWCRSMAFVMAAAFLAAAFSDEKTHFQWHTPWLPFLFVIAVYACVLGYALFGLDYRKSSNARSIAFLSVRPRKPPPYAMVRLILTLVLYFALGVTVFIFGGSNPPRAINILRGAILMGPFFLVMIVVRDWTLRI